MRYPKHWKGQIKITHHEVYGQVTLRGIVIGTARSRHSPGAKTSKGLVTDVVWEPVTARNARLADASTQTEAVDALIAASTLEIVPA